MCYFKLALCGVKVVAASNLCSALYVSGFSDYFVQVAVVLFKDDVVCAQVRVIKQIVTVDIVQADRLLTIRTGFIIFEWTLLKVAVNVTNLLDVYHCVSSV